MIIRKIAALTTAAALVLSGPAMAQSAASALSVAPRASASMDGENELDGGIGAGAIFGIIGFAVVLIAVIDTAASDDDNDPVSP